jgi:hypothetical protein
MIYRTLYMSRATRPLTDLDVELLAKRASEFNSNIGVTGLLLFDGRRFMQAIEGDAEPVDSLMANIKQDDRHDMLQIMAQGPARQRKFGDWAMAYKRVGEGCCTTGYLHQVKTAVAEIPNAELQAAFIGFAKLAYADEH